MKRLTLLILIILISFSFAEAGTVDPMHKENGETIYIKQVITPTADAANQALSSNLVGGYLFSVEIKSSSDDAMTFSIKSSYGTTIFTRTTTAATSGEIANPTGYWPINSIPTWTLSDFSGSGTLSIEITVVKR